MISNISFGSTYKVSSIANEFEKFSEFHKFALEKEMQTGVVVKFEDKIERNYPYKYGARCIVVADDFRDNEIETFCANKGIKYIKFNTNYLVNPETVITRIAPAKDGMKTAMVNVKKLEELAKRQQSNFNHCEKDYKKYFSEKTDCIIKSGEEFATSTLTLFNCSDTGKPKQLLDYIEKFGANRLNDGQIFVGFDQKYDYPDHCIFFALRDLGMDKVPVYVNENSLEIGKALGILE